MAQHKRSGSFSSPSSVTGAVSNVSRTPTSTTTSSQSITPTSTTATSVARDDFGASELKLSEMAKSYYQQWGISEKTLRWARVRSTSNGNGVLYRCEYPSHRDNDGKLVTPYIERTRNLPHALSANPELKRFYQPENDKCPTGRPPLFYTPDYEGLKANLLKNGGVLMLCEGDKDTQTLYELGFDTVAGMISASATIDRSLKAQFEILGVKSVWHYVDNDHAGWSLAEKMLELFEGTGIFYAPKSIDFEVNGEVVKDINEMWIMTEFDKERARQILHDARDVQFTKTKTNVYGDSLLSAIMESLSLDSSMFRGNGYTPNMPCPIVKHQHDDRSPSFGLNKDGYGKCFKCGKTYSPYDIALALGLNPSQYLKPVTSKSDSRVVQWDEMPFEVYAHDFHSGLGSFNKTLFGEVLPEYIPIENPMSDIMGHLGGACKVIPRPYMVGIVGRSGGFKTTTLTDIYTRLSMKGEHGIVFSPEWSFDSHIERIIQTFGGVSVNRLKLWERHLFERTQNFDTEQKFGQELTREEIKASLEVMNAIRNKFIGKIGFIGKLGMRLDDFKAQVKGVHKHYTSIGQTPSYLVVDYLSLLEPPLYEYDLDANGNPVPVIKSMWTLNDTVLYVKSLAQELGLVAFCGEQVRKNDSDASSQKLEILSENAANGMNANYFNLLMTINPGEVVYVDMPDLYGEIRQESFLPIKYAVWKNSLGQKAFSQDNAPHQLVHLGTLQICKTHQDFATNRKEFRVATIGDDELNKYVSSISVNVDKIIDF